MNQSPLVLSIIVLVIAIAQPSFAAEKLYTQQPSVTPSLAAPGELTVGVKTLEVVNHQQLSANDFSSLEDRPLTLEVWYPAAARETNKPASYRNQTRSGKKFELAGAAFRDATPLKSIDGYPLVVLSHGYTGYRTIMFYLGEHLASHGYVVAAIDHTDSRNSDIDFSNNSSAGFISTLLNRARDQQFVLEYFTKSDTQLAALTDTDKASVIGYSMGGYGALNTVGGCYSFSEAILQQFGVPAQMSAKLLPLMNSCSAGREKADPRWRAMIAYAPWGGELGVHSDLSAIKIPKLFIGGEIDDVSGYENGVKRLFEQASPTANHMMIYQNARHNIAAHPAPKVAYDNDLDMGHHYEPSWDIEIINRVNKHMNLAFLDCNIKTIKSACDMLPTSEDITQTKQADGSLSAGWPGFPERWGSGIKFYRR